MHVFVCVFVRVRACMRMCVFVYVCLCVYARVQRASAMVLHHTSLILQ